MEINAEQIGKLNGESVYLTEDGRLCIKKDNSYLVEMNEEQKEHFIKENKKKLTNSELNIANAELTTLESDRDE